MPVQPGVIWNSHIFIFHNQAYRNSHGIVLGKRTCEDVTGMSTWYIVSFFLVPFVRQVLAFAEWLSALCLLPWRRRKSQEWCVCHVSHECICISARIFCQLCTWNCATAKERFKRCCQLQLSGQASMQGVACVPKTYFVRQYDFLSLLKKKNLLQDWELLSFVMCLLWSLWLFCPDFRGASNVWMSFLTWTCRQPWKELLPRI